MQDNTRPTARRSLYRHAKIYQVKGSFRIRESIEKTYDEAVGTILDFITENKWISLNGATGSFSVRDNFGEMECIEFKNGHLWAARLQFRESEDPSGRSWIYELAVTETNGRLFFGCAVSMECMPNQTALFSPRLIFRLEERIGFNEFGGQPQCVNEFDAGQGFFDLVMSEERVLPIVAVAPLTAAKWTPNGQQQYLIDVPALAAHLNGYAHVVRFSKSTASEWSYCAGTKWAVFDGSVRILNPGFDVEHHQMDHPLFTKDRILYSEPGQPSPAKTFFSSLCTRIRRQVAETEMNFSEVIFLREARRLRRMVEHVLGMPPDSLTGASLLPQGKTELLAKRLEDSELELLETQCSLEEYRKLYGELPQKEPETPVVNTFSEIAGWCGDFLAGKLLLHPRDRKSVV